MKAQFETNFGKFILDLSEATPKTTENFTNLVQEGYYNSSIFHRVIKDFMVQGGGFDASMQDLDNKAAIDNEANMGGENKRGTIAMARTNMPHSASTQFFINTKDNAFLNFTSESPQGWGYCVFGQVVEGMETIDAIEKVSTGSRMGHQDVPTESVIIEKAFLLGE